MRVLTEPFPAVMSAASAVSIGKFDGVHLGHRAVLRELIARARSLGVEAVAVTFDRNPLEVIRPDRCPPLLVTLERKLELLAAAGVDATVVLRFDEARAAQAPEDFVTEILIEGLGARSVEVGADFRFGAKGAGSVATLRELGATAGFETVVVDDVGVADDTRISASRIRALVAEGRVREASVLLGALPSITGEVVHGHARGRDLGFPTANLAPNSVGPVPADGVYAGWLTAAGRRMPAAISVSDNPTFEREDTTKVEAYVIDEDLDLYGQIVEVEFQDRIRGIEAFSSIDDLIVRMGIDVTEARALLGVTAS